MRGLSALVFALLPGLVGAAPWAFGPAVPVTAALGPNVFHHLDASGRNNVAVADGAVAVGWEDNRSGPPEIYVAFLDGDRFVGERKVSGGEPAYEPAIAALSDGWFVLAWEEGEAIWLRRVARDAMDDPVRVSRKPAAYAALATGPQGAYAAWSEQEGRFKRIVVGRLGSRAGLEVGPIQPVEAGAPAHEQLYPAVAVTGQGLVVAWEDRRYGHTRLYHSWSADGARFTPPEGLNEQPPSRSALFGRGTGVTRVALAAHGAQGVVATWMDKRNFEGGYEVWAAFSSDGGRRFAANQQVQDLFGENIPQWHPTVAANRSGQVAIAWDDARDDRSDVWLSWPEEGGWSDDYAVPPASGDTQHNNPALAMDADGHLHLVWLEQAQVNGPTRLYYAFGRRQ